MMKLGRRTLTYTRLQRPGTTYPWGSLLEGEIPGFTLENPLWMQGKNCLYKPDAEMGGKGCI